MTYVRWSDDEDAVHEDLGGPSANEQLLRYIGMRAGDTEEGGRIYLVRADASYLGTDFP